MREEKHEDGDRGEIVEEEQHKAVAGDGQEWEDLDTDEGRR